MKVFKTVVIDDERLAREELKSILTNTFKDFIKRTIEIIHSQLMSFVHLDEF